MTNSYKQALWSMTEHGRGQLEMVHVLDIVTTVAASAFLDKKEFSTIKNMGASSILPALEMVIESLKPRYPLAFENSIELSRLSEQSLSQIVYSVAALENLEPLATAIREALLDDFSKAGGESGSSQYMEVLLPALVGDVRNKTLLDAACGLARMTSLVDAKESYLQEINPSIASLAQRLLLIEGKQANFSVGNSLLALEHEKQQFDLIVMEPPLGIRIGSQQREEIQLLPYILDPAKPIPTSGSDALWIQFALHHLDEFGKAYLLLPQGSLFRGGYDSSVREYLLNNELVDKVISLPSGSVNGTAIQPVLLILDKAKQKGSSIRFVDLRDVGTRKGLAISLEDEDLAYALKLVEGSIEDEQKACSKTVREIRQSESDNTGNNLNVSRYIQAEIKISMPSVKEQMTALNSAKNEFEKTQESLNFLLNQ